jgi:hypothetical protein
MDGRWFGEARSGLMQDRGWWRRDGWETDNPHLRRLRTLTKLLPLSLAAIFVLGFPATSLATQGAFQGVNTHSTWDHGLETTRGTWQSEIEKEVEEASALGVTVIRVPVEWRAIEESKGTRSGATLEKLEKLAEKAKAKSIKLLGTIATTPAWASTGTEHLWDNAPSEPEVSLKGFVKWLTSEASGSAAVLREDLLAVGIWNEPDQGEDLEKTAWKKSEAKLQASKTGLQELASIYVPMVKAVFLGAEGSGVKVFAPESGENQGDTCGTCEGKNRDKIFVEAAFTDGIAGHYNVWATHAYSEGLAPESTNEGSTKSKVERLHTFLVEKKAETPMWVTEWGYSTEDTIKVRGEYIEKGAAMLRTNTNLTYVEGQTEYQLRDIHENGSEACPKNELTSEKEECFGLVRWNFGRVTEEFEGFKKGI